MKIVIECEAKEIAELLTLVQVRQKDFDAEIDNWLEKVLHRSVANDGNQFRKFKCIGIGRRKVETPVDGNA